VRRTKDFLSLKMPLLHPLSASAFSVQAWSLKTLMSVLVNKAMGPFSVEERVLVLVVTGTGPGCEICSDVAAQEPDEAGLAAIAESDWGVRLAR
jgi:hypothetical protein